MLPFAPWIRTEGAYHAKRANLESDVLLWGHAISVWLWYTGEHGSKILDADNSSLVGRNHVTAVRGVSVQLS